MVSPTGTPPAPVQRSFYCWIATVVVSLIGSIVTLLGPGIPSVPGESAATSVVGLVIGLIFLALFVFLAFRLRQGLNWARLTLAILGGISVLFTIIGTLATGPAGATPSPLSIIVNVLSVVLIVAAIVFSYQGAANAWFR